MEKSGLVSVIMPFFNSEKFIQEAIDSVCAQTYPNWELLLIDDGSTDLSLDIVRNSIERAPGRIRCLQHSGHANLGTSASVNLGLRNAQGEYIALLDSDDVWLPNKLEDQLAILKSQPAAAMVFGNTLSWYSWTGKAEDQQRDYLPPRGVFPNTLIPPPELLIKCLQGRAAVPCTCSILMRRSALEAAGWFEEDFRFIYMDQAFFTKLFLIAPVYAADGWWDKYRRHPDSNCSIAERTNRLDVSREFYLRWVKKYLSQKGLEKSEVWQVTQKQLWLNHHPKIRRFLERSRRAARYHKGRLKARLNIA